MRTTGLSQAIRGAVAVLGALALVCGIVVALAGLAGAALWLVIVGAVLLLVTVYERTRYGAGEGAEPQQGAARGSLQRTDELFRDPTTGELTRVWYDPVTGERRYLPET